jgi:hypothetical protein
VVIVDDHLSLLAIAGRLPDLMADGPVVTTWGFQFRMARAVTHSSRWGSLSRRVADPDVALRRYLRPPANRLIVLDPRVSADQSVRIAVAHRANLLLAELAGSAVHYGAAVRLTAANIGRTWPTVLQTEGVDLVTVEP